MLFNDKKHIFYSLIIIFLCVISIYIYLYSQNILCPLSLHLPQCHTSTDSCYHFPHHQFHFHFCGVKRIFLSFHLHLTEVTFPLFTEFFFLRFSSSVFLCTNEERYFVVQCFPFVIVLWTFYVHIFPGISRQ